MATYVSQRRGRDVPAVTARRRAREAEQEAANTQASQADTAVESSPDDSEDGEMTVMASYSKVNVTEAARKQADQVGQAEIKKKAAELVRYALACEYQRTLIKKEDIRSKVLDDKTSRSFGPVFNAAQKVLHQTFGMYMVEVRAKGADNAELAKQAQEVLRAAASSANGLRPRRQQAAAEDSSAAHGGPGTNIWVLRSALSPALIKELVETDQELGRAYEQASSASSSSSSAQRRRQAAGESKAAVDWKRADHQDGEMGLLYVILALILVNGRTITDATLHMYLRRIHLQPHTLLPAALRGTGAAYGSASSGSQSTQTQARAKAMQGTLEGFLNAMTKQQYLEKQHSDVGLNLMDAAVNQAQTQGRRRGRTSGSGGRADDETTVWEWRWGSRAEAEVGEKRIAELISLLFTDPSATQDGAQAAEEEDDETQAIERERLAKRRKMLLTNIASVAGSQLVG
ncbi:uncharacterized protein SPSC_06480 [Sporisorium scitamineum]|uniref:MAGE domain-containing protein n=1 Tax=Sporisorium scitamineum TaxID=49012 RepID=A0A0F7S3F3_9BASI|nr:hypothetical protein [Sporisorium scitamineum]CDU26286.1 uncharacterized protein SPSC_06480 [Sporisorium scitamineum]